MKGLVSELNTQTVLRRQINEGVEDALKREDPAVPIPCGLIVPRFFRWY